jgi:lysophospholipase L1-like esterase
VKPGPFLRGVVFEPSGDVAYPRAGSDERLPADTWAMAGYPVGVRLEFVGDCEAVEIAYTTRRQATHLPGAGELWSLWRDGTEMSSAPASVGAGVARLQLSGSPADRATVYLPEGMQPTVTDVRAVGRGGIEPAPDQPRWTCYGDSIAEGWVASAPALGWAATAAREHHLDVANLGYAGAARGEIVSAQQVAAVPADVISVAYGTNCWTKVPFSEDMIAAGLEGFLRIVRDRQPDTPVLVISPILRPQAETTPNVLGATLAQLRERMEATVEALVAAGDPALRLVRGAELVTVAGLADGIHPNDPGHRDLANAIGPQLTRALGR